MKEKEILELFNEKIKRQEEKLIFIDLLEDLKTFEEGKNQDFEKPFIATHLLEKHGDDLANSINNELLHFARDDKEEIEKMKEYMEDIPNMSIKETFGTTDLGEQNTIACIPKDKGKGFSKDLQNLIDSKKITLGDIRVTRKLFIKYLIEYDLIQVGKNDLLLFTPNDLTQEEQSRFPESMQKIDSILGKLKELYGEEQYNLGMNLIEKKLKNSMIICRYTKKDLEKILCKISYSKIDYSTTNKTLCYLGEEKHKFTEGNKNTKFFDIMYSFPAGTEINFSQLHILYENSDDYYNSIDNEAINNKIIKFIGKQNEFIKSKTENKEILLFPQEKRGNNHFITRRI